MSELRATRAYVAGFGTSGSLVAGAALLFVLASAIVAFRGWPQVTGAQPAASVAVPRSGNQTTSSRATRLLTAAVTGTTARSSALASARAGRGVRFVGGPRAGGSGTGPASTGVTVDHPGNSGSGLTSCATSGCISSVSPGQTVTSTGDSLGKTVASTGKSLGTAVNNAAQAVANGLSGVSSPAASTVSGVGSTLGSVVSGATSAVGGAVTNGTTTVGQQLGLP